MKLVPTVVIFAHLIDVMRDVPLLNRNPFFEGDLTNAGMNYGVIPNVVGKAGEQFVSGFPKKKNNVEGFGGTLIEKARDLAQRSPSNLRMAVPGSAMIRRQRT